MYKYWIFITIFLFFTLIGNSQSKAISVFNGKAEIQLPDYYTPMSTQEVARRYPLATAKPTEAYNSKDQSVVFAFFPKNDKLTTDQMIAEKEKLFATYKNSKRVKWENGIVKSIKDKKYLLLSFYSGESAGYNVFNYQVFGEINGQIVMISVTCPTSVLSKERPTIDQALETFIIKAN